MERPVLVFDGDCGMCTRAAALVERRFRPHPEMFDVAPSQALDLPALGLTEAECEEALQWVAPGGVRTSGHAAVASMLRSSYPWFRPLGSLLVAPVIDRLAAVAYRWVARNRHVFPGGTAACAMPGTTTAGTPATGTTQGDDA